MKIKQKKFIGLLECNWYQKCLIYHELNLTYNVKIDNIDVKNTPVVMGHNFYNS